MKSTIVALLGASAMMLCSPLAFADAEWTGEGSLSAGSTTGNTETTDVGAGLTVSRDALNWRQTGELSADYGEADGEENKNRLFGALQLDRKFENPRWTAYGRGSYERDEFSGFDNRAFLGVGVGYQVLTGEATTWSLEGGPGYKIDEIADVFENNVLIAEGFTEESFAFRAGSRFAHAFSDTVSLSNDTDVLYAEVSTQINNSTALTAQLVNNLSARFSYDVRHETDPPLGSEQTDTATRLSLVYGFGG